MVIENIFYQLYIGVPTIILERKRVQNHLYESKLDKMIEWGGETFLSVLTITWMRRLEYHLNESKFGQNGSTETGYTLHWN